MRPPRSLAPALVGLSLALTAFSLASLMLPGTQALPDRPDTVTAVIFSLIFAAFPSVGGLVAWYRPEHPIGWLLLIVGLMLVLSVFSTEYAGRVVYAGATLPAHEVVAWAGGWAWFVAAGVALPLAIALFPTGRFLSGRWRITSLVLTASVVVVVVAALVVPGDLEGWEGRVRNPFGIEGHVGEAASAVYTLGTLPLLVQALVALSALVVRFRRSRGAERAQLKWLLLPVTVFLSGLVAASAIVVEPLLTLSWTLALVGLAGVPIAAGVAILRHRLFDIDVVIRRTLVYAGVIGVLAVVYVGLVLASQAALSDVTGSGPLPVALSTLAVAGLFGPVRSRVRDAVDRRFYRARYDAQATLDRFAARLRDEVELEAVARSLTSAASQTVRPSAVGVWIRAR